CGWTRTDVYLQDRHAGGPLRTVAAGDEILYGVTPRNDRLYLHTNRDAPRYRFVVADPERPEPELWRELIPEGPDVLEGVAVIGDRLLALWLREASSRLTLHDLDGRLLREIPLPAIGSVAGLTGEWDGREAFFGFSSYAVPPAVYRVA